MEECCANLRLDRFTGFVHVEAWNDDGVGVFSGGTALVGNILCVPYNKVITVWHIDDGRHDFDDFLQFQPLCRYLVLHPIQRERGCVNVVIPRWHI